MDETTDNAAQLLNEAVALIDDLTAIIEETAPHRLTAELGERGANLMERIGEETAPSLSRGG